MSNKLIFSLEKYNYMAIQLKNGLEKRFKKTKFEAGEVEKKKFPDGETYLRILSNVRGKDCIIVGGTIDDTDLIELYSLASTSFSLGAKSLTLVIPYFGYSTMERSTKSGEVVSAKIRAKILSSIPKSLGGNRILLLDLHSEGIPYYFEGDVVTEHVYAKPVILDIIKNHFKGRKDFILGSTDAGRAKWVESLSKELNCKPAFIYKERVSGSETLIKGVSAEVSGKDVMVYDDMIRTGGSLIKAGEEYKKLGAKSISAIATHGIFPEVNGVSSLKKIVDTNLFEKIYFTDSYAPLKQFKDFYGIGSMHSVVDVFLQSFDFLEER